MDDDAGGRFEIDSVSGIVTVTDGTRLDREAAASHLITVRATSADNSTATADYTINVSDIDEFDVGSIADSDPKTNSVNENVANGAVIGTAAFATDDDATNSSVSYSLINDAGGRFAIDSVTGIVTVADGSLLDYEAATSHSFTVRAMSTDGSFTDQAFNTMVIDVNEAPAVSLANVTNTVNENTNTVSSIKFTDILVADDALGTNILSLTGADAALFEIVGGNELHLRAGTVLDYEAVTQYDVTVEVDDATVGASPDDSVAHTVSVLDLDDMAPIIQAGQVFNVAENATINTLLGTLIATDIDTVTPLSDWTIIAGNNQGLFQTTNAILLLVDTNLNFEQVHTYTLNVTVSDGTQTSAAESLTVIVTDVNDRPIAIADQFVTAQLQGITVLQPGVLVNDFDEDGDALTANIVTTPANGTVSLSSDGSLTYSPTANFFGTDTFEYIVSDGLLNSPSTTVRIVVRLLFDPASPDGNESSNQNGGGIQATNPLGVVATPKPKVTYIANMDSIDPSTQNSKNGINQAAQEEVVVSANSAELVDEVTSEDDVISAKIRSLRNYLVNSNTKLSAVHACEDGINKFLSSTSLSVIKFGKDVPEGESERITFEEYSVGALAVLTPAFTGVYIAWLIRGGSLLASFVSILPAWTSFDPLPILCESEENDDKESLVDIANCKNVANEFGQPDRS